MRKDWDDWHFAQAEQTAERATCDRAHIGAVAVTRRHRIVAACYNGALSDQLHCEDAGCLFLTGVDHCMRAVHAEANVVTQLRELFESVCDALGVPLTKQALCRWVRSQWLTVYVSGNRDVCSGCAREMYEIGIMEVKWRSRHDVIAGSQVDNNDGSGPDG